MNSSLLPILVSAAAVCGLLACERMGHRPGIAVAKLSASTAFVWAALAWGATGSLFGLWVLAGLVLCWAGRCAADQAGQTLWFQLGIAAFLLGHLCYAGASLALGIDTAAALVAAALVALVLWRVLAWLGPHVPDDFRIPVRAYVGVIGAMVVATVGAAFAGGPWLLALGAVGFAASDLSVARERFVHSAFANAAWGLPAYFASQLAIAGAIAQAAAASAR